MTNAVQVRAGPEMGPWGLLAQPDQPNGKPGLEGPGRMG